jgi:uncharacterized cupin superfamily protein
VLEREFVLVTDAGRGTVGPGTCIGFPAGTGDGHHLLNHMDKDAVFLVVGDLTAGEEVTYPDIDLELKAGPDGVNRVPSQGWHAVSALAPGLRACPRLRTLNLLTADGT